LRGLAGDMERMAAEFTDLFAPEAMERYFREVYWRHGPDRLDRGRIDKLPICERFRVSANQTDFAYRSVAENYALIESGMLPVIVPRDAESEDAVHKLSARTIPSGTLARR